MIYLVFGLALVLIVHLGMRAFVRANPSALALLAKRGGGILSLVAAGFLLLRGRVNLAISLGGLALWLLGLGKFPNRAAWAPFGGSSAETTPDGISKVRSATVEMKLDHASGAMHGTMLSGEHAGKSLDDLSRAECMAIHARCTTLDPDGARLLEAYLDRRFPDWQAAEHGDGDHAHRDGGARPGAMTEDEAYEVLGLQKGATPDDIAHAHRTLMKKLHPDHGGTTNLAARVNAAKDVLIRRPPSASVDN